MSVKVKQRDITDCGAACLASVAAHYKLKLPVARIRQFAGTDKKGTNVLGLVEASKKIGFMAKGVKGEWDSLFKIPKPSIAHVVIDGKLNHYVVLVEATKDYIKVMDPGDGEYHKLSHEKFREQWSGVLVLLAPDEMFRMGNEKVSLWQRFWQLIRPHRGVLLQALVGGVVYTILGLSSSIYIGKIVDYVLPSGNTNLLNLLGIAMVVIILMQQVLSYLQSMFVLKTGQRIDLTLILGYYQHLLKLPMQFFDNMRTGEIISRINDAVKIRVFVNDVSINLLINIFILITSFLLMFAFYWKLAVVMLAIIPIYGTIYYTINKLNKRVQRRVMERSAELEAQLVESLNSVGTIKRFGLEGHTNLKTELRFVELLKTVYSSGKNSIFSSMSTGMVSQLFTVVLLWFGAGYVLSNQITPGELLSFYAIIGYFTGPVASIIGFNKTLQDALIASDRLFEIMDLEQEDESNKVELTSRLIGDLRFQNVSFRYGTRVQVFSDLNLTISKGSITAIVGESGSGKTTLMSLLQNLYPIQAGQVFIGNYDIRYLSNKSLRQQLCVVPQKIDLFAGNVVENIAIGDMVPDMEKIHRICHELGMLPLIEELPQGFATYLGENGVSLSGGQRQRVAIARALYRDPEILILDEATASLDVLSEKAVQHTIHALKDAGKTVIVIAHRLSTVVGADKIVVLEKGAVVEEGEFHQLANANGPFSRMWSQSIAQPINQK